MSKKKNTYNAADSKHIADQEEKERLNKEQHEKDLQEVLRLQSGAGVRVFSRILEDGKMFTSSFTGNSATFFNEGMRNLALKIFAEICESVPDKVQSIILKTKEITDG